MDVNNHNPNCASLMAMAGREFVAFMNAVTELYGPQARISAEDWLDELESVGELPGFTRREWRLITIAAAARLASMVNDSCSPPLVPGSAFQGGWKTTCRSLAI